MWLCSYVAIWLWDQNFIRPTTARNPAAVKGAGGKGEALLFTTPLQGELGASKLSQQYLQNLHGSASLPPAAPARK